ncbi:MAG: hypothetical protein KBS76_00280, partial [Ruminococcus sp.]|nr:hypothetical protein [Candidatus Apopatosoma intestinale]
MRKRIISILLAALSATCILPVGTITAVAAPDPSDDQIVEATVTYDAEKKIYKVLGNGKNNVLNWATFDIDEKET